MAVHLFFEREVQQSCPAACSQLNLLKFSFQERVIVITVGMYYQRKSLLEAPAFVGIKLSQYLML
jgi:hypothetical protein